MRDALKKIWADERTMRFADSPDPDQDEARFETLYFHRDAVRQVMVDVSAGSVPQETIDLCRAEGVDPHDALQMGYACACFKLKALLDALDEDPTPRPKGPTPEAGYQSLLRETAGERLGATKGDEG